MKTFKVNLIFKDGTPSTSQIIQAQNPPQARKLAEMRYNGKCTSANEVY